MAEWLRRRIANPFYVSSNLMRSSNLLKELLNQFRHA
ncbi:hypothetical protein [Escherichia phage Es2]|uniref:Uncharacterized protein n=1 Tax=Salmonella phage vB_Si_CECAV_FGS009 TaxID=3126494 RepID=A0AAU6PYA8_9CAUD|nr:hypothetical protein [Escherichia phage Es2]